MPKILPVALTGLILTACGTPAPSREWHDEPGYRWRDLALPGRGTVGFTAMDSVTTGIRFTNTVSDSAAQTNRHLMDGSGVAIGDVNGDQRPDIYLCRIEGPNALYLNEGNWRFREVARESGVALGDRPSTGAVFADLNGDGSLDLLVASLGGKNSLFLNDGQGHFRDATSQSGFVPESKGTTTMTLADVDGNGTLDLYVANYKVRTMLDSIPPTRRSFDSLTRRTRNGYEVRPEFRGNYRLVDRPELGRISLVQRADPDWFYRGDGAGGFVREPLDHNPRFLDQQGVPLDREPEEFTLAARFYDLNGDGAPDLYVANDFEDPDQFWINDGKGSFRLIAPGAVRRIANSNMAVDMADIDRDGNVDLFQVDMLANDRRIKTQLPTHTTYSKVLGDYSRTAQWQRNALLLNRGDGTFAEIADFAGVAGSGWSWSTLFLDVDLDGFEDLLIGNGHTWDLMDADVHEREQTGGLGRDWREQRKAYPRLALRNVAFRNRGDRTFEDASERWRWGIEEDISHGIANGDLDDDGDQDVVVNRLDAPAQLFRNDARGSRIAVRAVGAPPNTGAIGARIRVLGGAVPDQSREVTAGGLYLSGADQALSFATGNARTVTLEVRWRNGVLTRIRDAMPGREYEIREGARASGVGTRDSGVLSPNPEPRTPSPLFEDVSRLLNHRHSELPFNDFRRQPLLPWSLSQLGPGVSWFDVDRDGREDLLVPDGAGGELAWLRNEGSRFTRVPLGFPATSLDFTMALGFAQGDRRSLIVGRSSYRAETLEEAIRLAGVARLDLSPDGKRVEHAEAIAGPDSASVGALALADADGSGGFALFVAGRVIPGEWPLPTSSHLYRLVAGRFQESAEDAAVFRGTGPVSAATFTDLTGDGLPELILAVDGGPIRFFRNDAGRFRDETVRFGLDRLRGNWNGVAAGDFDGDGRLDLIATNWGRNLPWGASPASPLYLYLGQFGDGSLDVIPAREDSALKAIAPFVSFARLNRVLPGLRRQVPSFAAYANASIEKLLGSAFGTARRVEITMLDHVVLLNRGDRFESHALPDEAQFAPGFGAVVNDFDGDGREDVFLAQNFSATELGTPRFDAGRGLVLLGDGRGGFAPMPGQFSGIQVYGDQRGAAAADFDADGRVDLAVAQNAGETRLFRNRGATTGLRVRVRGSADNPDGIGVSLRVRYDDGEGPAREIQAGAGYWSSNGALVVMGLRGTPRALVVRWPGGKSVEVPVTGAEITIEESGVRR